MSGGPLAGRSALVTGASRGIGRALARLLAKEGVRLALSSRGGEALEAAAAELEAVAVPADLSAPDGPERLAEAARARLGGAPDLLFNVAGVFELSPAARTSAAVLDRHLSVNVRAPLLLSRSFLPELLERGWGRLVHFGSVAGRRGFPENAAYAASKHALRGFHRVLRLELTGTGVASVLVEPGPVDTGAWDPYEARLGDDLPPRASMLRPETVARAVVGLLRHPGEAVQGELCLLPA